LPVRRKTKFPLPTVQERTRWMLSTPQASFSVTQTIPSSSEVSRAKSLLASMAALYPYASPGQACPWNLTHSSHSGSDMVLE